MTALDRLRNPDHVVAMHTARLVDQVDLDWLLEEYMGAHPMTELRDAAQAVVDRWAAPLWKDAEPTAHVINRLREALATEPPPDAPALTPVVRYEVWHCCELVASCDNLADAARYNAVYGGSDRSEIIVATTTRVPAGTQPGTGEVSHHSGDLTDMIHKQDDGGRNGATTGRGE